MKNYLKKVFNNNNLLYTMLSNIYHKFITFLYYLLRIFRIKSEKIVFCSYYGNGYSDNAKYIAQEIINQKLKYDMVWLLRKELINDNDIPKEIRIVKYGSLRAIYEMVTAGIWIDNARKEYYVRKRAKQYYIQTWHGTPLKKIEKDAGKKLTDNYHKNSIYDSKNINLLLSGNEYSTRILKNCFWYDGKILESGMPRNDIFYDDYNIINKKVKNILGLKNEKIIFFAPTFRNDIEKNGLNQLEELNIKSLLIEFEKYYLNDCILLVRFHPNVANKINLQELECRYGNKILNVSEYPDMQELLSISDVLITDYSSAFFDFSLLKRPIFLFMQDYDEYKEERGVYLDINDIPLYIVKSSSELLEGIKSMNEEEMIKRSEKFLEYLGNKERGVATLEVINWINKVICNG
ncbi:CDP-glycerol glycerophosphotransferase [Clostridium cavendishii DSM 21758]|uniref:CDP-glycerol glycerophosphotransferase n=1 Tax=Clostridium cavendishii DSM 21758 TaxID=1121302 RepID=A0A1M6QDE0_9CLOT|nr:CDP-glycerol glycerophosphotransferase family protein [Clostridium cavendishii]SHK18206.1 CDP-glycerol glycerophosphotransferase [Clostridium cavendishii DSM 21758]